MDRIHVIILPNKEYMDIANFYKTSTTKGHVDILKEFYIANDLELVDDLDLSFNLVREKNSIVIMTLSNQIIMLMPSIVSEEQLAGIKYYRKFFEDYDSLVCGICDTGEEIEIDMKNSQEFDDFYERISNSVVKEQAWKI